MKAHFQPILSQVRLRSLFKELVAQQTRVRLWPRSKRPPAASKESADPEPRLEAEFRITGMNPAADEIFCHAADAAQYLKFKSWRASDGTGEFIATIQSSMGLLFMNTTVTEVASRSIRLHSPQTVYEVQRRASLRAPIPERITIRISFEDPHRPGAMMVQEVMDLGQGGLSFAVPESRARSFSKGLELGTIRFTLAGRQISCQAVVRGCRSGKIRGSLNAAIVGIQFRRLPESDRPWIGAWVLRQSRYFIQRLDR